MRRKPKSLKKSRYICKLLIMKLESLKLDKFKNEALKKEQMFALNGSGTVTPGGHREDYTYGYDSDRGNGWITYHNRKKDPITQQP